VLPSPHRFGTKFNLLKFLPLANHHSHFLAATLDFIFFTVAFVGAAHCFYSGTVFTSFCNYILCSWNIAIFNVFCSSLHNIHRQQNYNRSCDAYILNLCINFMSMHMYMHAALNCMSVNARVGTIEDRKKYWNNLEQCPVLRQLKLNCAFALKWSLP